MARKSRKQIITTDTDHFYSKETKCTAWGYARISIDGERSEDSIEGQTAIIHDYVKEKNDIDLRKVVTDLGYTGTDFDRPGYVELIEGIKRGDVQCVLVKDLSRLGRIYIEVGELLFDTLPAYNVRFISVNDQYDSFADDAARKKLLILFKNLVNHMYSKDLGKKIRSAHNVKKQRGELAGNTPYGYKRGEDGKTLALDGDAAEIVKKVFDMRLSGVSANKIMQYLNREGIPSPQNRRYQLGQITHEKFSVRIFWNIGMVRNILRSETYTGTLVQGKYNCDGKKHTLLPKEQWIKHENTHPAIVSREQYETVQVLMDEVALKYEHGKNKPLPKNIYVGKIFCSRCGHSVARVNGGRKGLTRFYYKCRTCDDNLKYGLSLQRLQTLPLETLETIVIKTLREQINSFIDFDKLVKQLAKSERQSQRRKELSSERLKCEKAINNADKTLSAAYMHHLSGLLGLREFDLVRKKIEFDKQAAVTKLTESISELKKYDSVADNYKYWSKVYKDFSKNKTPTKEMVDALVSRIEVDPLTNGVHVILNFADGLNEYKEILDESEVLENAYISG